MTKVEVTRSFYGYRVKLNGSLHLYIPAGGDMSLESWVDNSSSRFYIEFKAGDITTRSEYESKETWLEILKQMDGLLP